jgi:hypothetical protein
VGSPVAAANLKAVGSAVGNGVFAPGKIDEMLSQQQHLQQH